MFALGATDREVRARSSGTSSLRTIATEVLYSNPVLPRDVIHRNSKGGCQQLALRRACNKISRHHGLDSLPIESRGADELAEFNSRLFHAPCQGLHRRPPRRKLTAFWRGTLAFDFVAVDAREPARFANPTP